MKKFEYIETIHNGHTRYNNEHPKDRITLEQYMNMLGQQGWEIFPGGMARREIEPETDIKDKKE